MLLTGQLFSKSCRARLRALEPRSCGYSSSSPGGGLQPFDVFPGHHKRNERRVFDYWEVGALLDGLARCPVPAVSGLEEGPFTLDMHNDAVRHARYKQSRLSLTDLGNAVLAGEADFLQHNPIHRWWGGTELTNEKLWRWDPETRSLIARR